MMESLKEEHKKEHEVWGQPIAKPPLSIQEQQSYSSKLIRNKF